MLFNSLSFAIFLPVVFVLYWLIGGKRLRLQNLFIVAASYVFYGWWDWKFLLLITFTSLWAWASGLTIARLAYTPQGYRGGGKMGCRPRARR